MAPAALYTPSELLLRNDPLVAYHQEEGRRAFGSLLESVGSVSFCAHAVDYLRTYLKIDRAIIAVFSTLATAADALPQLLFHDLPELKACELYLGFLKHYCLPAVLADDAWMDKPVTLLEDPPSFEAQTFARALRRFVEPGSDLRLMMPIDELRVAVLVVGKAQWLAAESSLALRCAAFLRPTMRAHLRSCDRLVMPRGLGWQLDQIRSCIGEWPTHEPGVRSGVSDSRRRFHRRDRGQAHYLDRHREGASTKHLQPLEYQQSGGTVRAGLPQCHAVKRLVGG